MRFAVRAKPGAKRDAVSGSWPGTTGPALLVAVRAPATGGKANDALRGVLAEALGVCTRDVVIVAGARGRDKVVETGPASVSVEDCLATLY